MPVELRNAQRRVKIDTRGLKQDAQKLLSALELQEQTVSLLLTGDKEMAQLNLLLRKLIVSFDKSAHALRAAA
mgnify:CR=1 FL=1